MSKIPLIDQSTRQQRRHKAQLQRELRRQRKIDKKQKNIDQLDKRLSKKGMMIFGCGSVILFAYYYWIFTIDLEINPLFDRSHKYVKNHIDHTTFWYILLLTLLMMDAHIWQINKRIIRSNLFKNIIILGNVIVITFWFLLVLFPPKLI